MTWFPWQQGEVIAITILNYSTFGNVTVVKENQPQAPTPNVQLHFVSKSENYTYSKLKVARVTHSSADGKFLWVCQFKK